MAEGSGMEVAYVAPTHSLERKDEKLFSLIRGIPKAELHIHLEGSLEPEMMFAKARANNVTLPYSTVEAVAAAYQFNDLQSFLDLYYLGSRVLVTEQDFFDLTWAYLTKASSDGVKHVEAFFDPQSHTSRGVPFASVIRGIHRAMKQAEEELDMSTQMIMCFLRHLSEEEAIATLKEAEPYRELISTVGLDSSEKGNPPEKFERVYAMARAQGYRAVAHAGEEGPACYITNSLDLLKVQRVDHGVRCLDDSTVVDRLAREQVPLTVCPMSNVKLRVFSSMEDHTLRKMMEFNLLVTVNSDDPSYFGGYIGDNFYSLFVDLNLSMEDLLLLAKNSFKGSFISDEVKAKYIGMVEEYSKVALA